MGFEPMIRVLQTLALPLGHVALRGVLYQRAGARSSQCRRFIGYRAGRGTAPTIYDILASAERAWASRPSMRAMTEAA